MLILIAVLAIFGLGGGAVLLDELRDRVEASVADSDRLQSVQEILDEVESSAKARNERLLELSDQVLVLTANYQTTENDHVALTAKGLKIADDLRAKLLDLRFSMKEKMTREEWAAVFPTPESK
jgi:hypothetical protein